jgi:hypothetical protein
MKKVTIILISFLLLLGGCQQQIVTSLCEDANEYNLQEKQIDSSQTVHKCLDDSGNTVFLVKTGYPEEVSDKYYSSDGLFITKIVVDDTDQTWQYDKNNNILQEGFYLDLTLPKYVCEEQNLC